MGNRGGSSFAWHMSGRPAYNKIMEQGKLKIFLGYAAGVGKTYAMLEAARQRKANGVDVAAALVDGHGQADIEDLSRSFEHVPPCFTPTEAGVQVSIDVDAVLARRPTLVLVDDLERANPPGARHPFRYQDVEDLLAAGIHVYATLNVQHLASLNDVIHQVTGLDVTSNVPDSLLDTAAEIEVVDLPPEELLQRLREGRVHIPETERAASDSFYRLGNLTALRELTLRQAADRVDDQMRDYMQARAIPGPWPAGERLLVCISASPMAERLVRATRRLADDLDAPWYVVHVELPGQSRQEDKREQVLKVMHLAEELGGQVVILEGRAVAPAVIEFARQNNVTKIIAGKPLRPRWRELFTGSTVDQIIRESGAIDVQLISGQAEVAPSGLPERLRPHRPFGRYLASALLVVLAALLSALVAPYLDPANLVMIYLAAVVGAAFYLGRGPSFLASLLSVAVFELVFVVPRTGFSTRDVQYLFTFSGLLLVGWLISNLAAVARDQVSASRRREAQNTALNLFSRELTVALGVDDVLNVILKQVSQTFSREVVVFLPENNVPRLRASTANMQLGVEELRAIHWAFEHGENAGRGTDTLPGSKLRAMPMHTSRGIVGVIGVMPPDSTSYLEPEQRRLLESFVSLSALAVERAALAEQASQSQVLQAAERLQAALLNSISHDLRSPLASITGVLSSLKESKVPGEDHLRLDEVTEAEMIDTALGEASRLNRLVANLLDMTRLEAGALRLKIEPCDLQDLIGASLSRLGDRLERHLVRTSIPDNLPLVPLDFVMMSQVLVNLLDNAVKYSPPGTSLEIAVEPQGGQVFISVADEGMGIPPEDLEKVFDKFYRVQRKVSMPGTGLGLAIARGIVEAHGGRIWAENRPQGGLIVKLSLPVPKASVIEADGNKAAESSQ